jgi:hypothetical protein
MKPDVELIFRHNGKDIFKLGVSQVRGVILSKEDALSYLRNLEYVVEKEFDALWTEGIKEYFKREYFKHD